VGGTVRFYSTERKSPSVSFRDALFNGLAPDGGLYMPETIPRLTDEFLISLSKQSLHSAGHQVASAFIEDIPIGEITKIVVRALNFPCPLVPLEEGMYLLELFHGPTFAFKDFGARFMAEAFSYFLRNEQRELTIIVATSGDTGSAVAHGFYNQPHIKVFVLYPSGKISPLQEKQIATLGGNIVAVEVEGTFDDCQRLAKQALSDPDLRRDRAISSANSINIGRLLPQIFYYVAGVGAWLALKNSGKAEGQRKEKPLWVVVPSGNFGNMTAGLFSKWMGLPIERFIAATNVNDVVPRYFKTGTYVPRPAIPTISNAMDVGNPSNLARMRALYGDDLANLKRDVEAVSVNDQGTLEELKHTYEKTGYILDPHTALGVAAARRVRSAMSGDLPDFIILATAHRAKFGEVIKTIIRAKLPIPDALATVLHRPKKAARVAGTYRAFKDLLLAH
jgi:threonine synthase